MGLNISLGLTLPALFEQMGWPPHAGLALANTIATVLEFTLLLLVIRRRMGGLEIRRTGTSLARSGLAALTMGAVLVAWQTMLAGTGWLVLGGGGMLVGVAAYVVAALLLRTEELGAVAALIRPRKR